MNMQEYVKESARTAAAPKVNYDEILPHDNGVLNFGMNFLLSGDIADQMKRRLFYGKAPEHSAMQERASKLRALFSELETKQVTLSEDETNLVHAILGIVSEAGEMMEELIEAKLNNRPVNKKDGKGSIFEESGDVMWYMAMMMRYIDCSFEEVCERNINKLKTRYPDKFTTENAVNRNLDEEAKALAS